MKLPGLFDIECAPHKPLINKQRILLEVVSRERDRKMRLRARNKKVGGTNNVLLSKRG